MKDRILSSARTSSSRLGSLLREVVIVGLAIAALASISHAGTTNIVLRLDASKCTSAGTISIWADTSGNGHDAAASGNPEVVLSGMNGLSVVRLDGNDYFTIPDNFTAGSAFVVAKYISTTFNGHDGLLSGDNTGDGNALYFSGSSGNSYLAGETSLNSRYFDGVSGTTGPTALSIDQMSLYSGTDSTPTAWNGYAIGADRPTGLFGGSRAWDGDIAEVIVYDDALSDFDRKGVEVYLDEKWDLGLNLRSSYGAANFNGDLDSLGLGPAELTMALRLDSSEFSSAVTGLETWSDTSGNGHDATRSNPSLRPNVVMDVQNGLPVVRFDGSDDCMTVAHTYTTGSGFIVAKYDADGDDAKFDWYDGLYGSGTDNGGSGMYWTGSNNSGSWEGGGQFSGSRYRDGVLSGAALSAPDTFHLYNGGDTTPNSFTAWSLGRDRAIGGRTWQGDIAEVVIYEEALSDYDRKGVEVYLDEKWGLGLNLRSTYGPGSFNEDPYALGLASPTMVLRLDASILGATSALATWVDRSGNGHAATQGTAANQPSVVSGAQNGLSVVRCDGSGDFMTVAHAYTCGTAFIIAKYTSATFNGWDGLYGSGTDNGSSGQYWSGNNGAATWGNEPGGGFHSAKYFNGALSHTALTSPSAFNLYSGVDTTPNSHTSWSIGRDRGIGGRTWEGDIAEVVVYEEALTDFDRKGVEVYLDEKWGLNLGLRASYGTGNFNDDSEALGFPSGATLFLFR